MRSAVIALVATAVAGLLALAIVGKSDERRLAFTLGVVPAQVAAELRPDATVCQRPVAVSTEFARILFGIGTYGRLGGPLDVEVRALPGGRVLASGTLPAGYGDSTQQSVDVGTVRAPREVEVCITNRGAHKSAIYGGVTAAAPNTEAYVGGRPTGADLSLVFDRSDDRTMLATVPDIFERASLFRPGWVASWTFWMLAALLLVGVPALLSIALARVSD
jgi:hypothetical protein